MLFLSSSGLYLNSKSLTQVPFWSLFIKLVQCRTAKMMKGLKHLSCEQKLRDRRFQPREEVVRGEITVVSVKYLK